MVKKTIKKFINLSEASELVEKSTKTIRRLVAKEEKENPRTLNIKRISTKFGKQIEVSRPWLLTKLFLEKKPVKEANKEEVEKFMTTDIENMVVRIARKFPIYGKDIDQKVNEGRSHLISKIPQWKNTGIKKAWVRKVLDRFFIDEQRKHGKEIIYYNVTPEPGKESGEEKTFENQQESLVNPKEPSFGQSNISDKNDEKVKSTGDDFLDSKNISNYNKRIIFEKMKEKFEEDWERLLSTGSFFKEGDLIYEKKAYNKKGRRVDGSLIVVSPKVWDEERELEKYRFYKTMEEIEKTLRAEKNEVIYAVVILGKDYPELAKVLIGIIEGGTHKQIFGLRGESVGGGIVKTARETLKELFGFDIKKGSLFPQNKEANMEEVKKRRAAFYRTLEKLKTERMREKVIVLYQKLKKQKKI